MLTTSQSVGCTLFSNYESSVFREALIDSKKQLVNFAPLVDTLGSMGCRELPTPRNVQQLIVEVTKKTFFRGMVFDKNEVTNLL